MTKKNRIYFLTAYVEYLLEKGIRSEEYYLSDASRYIRFLLRRADESDLQAFIESSASSPSYRKRLRKTLRKFYGYASEHLDVRPIEEHVRE